MDVPDLFSDTTELSLWEAYQAAQEQEPCRS